MTTVNRVGSIAERLKELPYEKRVCRVEQYPSFCRGPEDETPDHIIEEYVDLIHEAGVEAHICQSTHNRGTPMYPSKMLPPHAGHEKFALPKFLAAAHEKGINAVGTSKRIFTSHSKLF